MLLWLIGAFLIEKKVEGTRPVYKKSSKEKNDSHCAFWQDLKIQLSLYVGYVCTCNDCANSRWKLEIRVLMQSAD